MLIRHRIAEVLYAGTGAGILEPVGADRVDDTVDTVMEAMADGRLHPRMLAAHGEGLRQWLGLPAGEWTAAAEAAARRGRQMCTGQQQPESPEPYDENKGDLASPARVLERPEQGVVATLDRLLPPPLRPQL